MFVGFGLIEQLLQWWVHVKAFNYIKSEKLNTCSRKETF